MKVNVTFMIGPNGEVVADVVGGQGKVCITEILGPLEELLGTASYTKHKPEYALDREVIRLLKGQEAGL